MNPSFIKKLGPIQVDEIQSLIKCEALNVKKNEKFNNFVSIKNIETNSLSFLYDSESPKYQLPENTGLICTEKKAKVLRTDQKLLVVKNVQESVARLSNLFYEHFNSDEINKFHKPKIGLNCKIAENVVIENGVIIGDNVEINHGAIIKHNCIIGNGSRIDSNSIIEHSILSENIYVGTNTSIGQKGFGFHLNDKKNIDIFHIGRVIIQSNASIGSGCTNHRGSFSDTVIGKNTYLDNLCHIAHNVQIGNNCAFAAMTGVAGSAIVGNNVLTGGQAGIAGHVTIGNNVRIAAKSGVFQNVNNNESVMGNPAINKYKFIKSYKKIYGKK